MKKGKIFLLVLGLFLMIGGGIGGVFFYQRAQKTMVSTKNESYTIKNKQKIKKMVLNISGNANYYIQGDTGDEIALKSHSVVTYPVDGTLDVTESADTLTINITGEQAETALSYHDFGIHFENSQLNLTVPSDIDELIVNDSGNGTITMTDFENKNVKMDLDHSDLAVYSIIADQITIDSARGEIYFAGDSQIGELTATTDKGDIYLSDFVSEVLTVSTTSGDIELAEIKSTKSSINSKNGDISINNLRGEAEISANNGDLNMYGEEFPNKLTATTNHGDISISIYGELDNFAIQASSELGDIDLFGSEKATYSKGNEKNNFILKTKVGDIQVY